MMRKWTYPTDETLTQQNNCPAFLAVSMVYCDANQFNLSDFDYEEIESIAYSS